MSHIIKGFESPEIICHVVWLLIQGKVSMQEEHTKLTKCQPGRLEKGLMRKKNILRDVG